MNPRTLTWIFRGSQGIRAGWSVAIFGAILAVQFIALKFAAERWLHVSKLQKGDLSARSALIAEAISVIVVLIATAIMAKIEGRSPWSYGLASGRRIRQFLTGWLGGLIFLSSLVAALVLSGHLVFDGLYLHGLAILQFGLVWFLGFALVGLNEEILARGYLQSTLARGVGFWGAALLTSLLFSLGHLRHDGENILGIASAFAVGMAFCLLLQKSGSLWLGIGIHAAWDWAQSYLYGTPDSSVMIQGHLLVSHAVGDARVSGGTAGPEGSVLAMPALFLGILGLLRVARRTGLLASTA